MGFSAGDPIPGTKEATEVVKSRNWDSFPADKKDKVPVKASVSVRVRVGAVTVLQDTEGRYQSHFFFGDMIIATPR